MCLPGHYSCGCTEHNPAGFALEAAESDHAWRGWVPAEERLRERLPLVIEYAEELVSLGPSETTPGTRQSWRRPADSRTACERHPSAAEHRAPPTFSGSRSTAEQVFPGAHRLDRSSVLLSTPSYGRDDPPRRRTGEVGRTRPRGRAKRRTDSSLHAGTSTRAMTRITRCSLTIPAASGGPKLTPKLTPKVTPYGADARAIPGHPWKRKSANSSAKRTIGRHRTRADRRESSFQSGCRDRRAIQLDSGRSPHLVAHVRGRKHGPPAARPPVALSRGFACEKPLLTVRARRRHDPSLRAAPASLG